MHKSVRQHVRSQLTVWPPLRLVHQSPRVTVHKIQSIPSSHQWGAIPHNSPYTRFKSIPSSHEWEQSRKAKKFHRAFSNYDLLLFSLDASSIYLHDSKCVAPPKSGEDAHVTCGRWYFGGTSLNKPSLCFSYVLPRLWDPGGIRSPSNVPRD